MLFRPFRGGGFKNIRIQMDDGFVPYAPPEVVYDVNPCLCSAPGLLASTAARIEFGRFEDSHETFDDGQKVGAKATK